jgi:hypothetical protein
MIDTFTRHLGCIIAGSITKTNVIGIRKAINNAERIRNGWSANRCNVTPEQADELEQSLDKYRPRVCGELHDSGLAVLRNPRYAKRWSKWQLDAIETIDHFKLIGYQRIGHRGSHAIPVYSVWCTIEGGTYEAFRFINIPWQSGGNGPEIL